MSTWINNLWPGNWGRVPQTVTPQDAPTPEEAAPQAGRDETGPQNNLLASIGYGALRGFGNYPPFAAAYVDECLETAALALVRGTVKASILSGGPWVAEEDEDAPDGAKDGIERSFAPHRDLLLDHGLSALDYGAAFFAPIWDVRDGMTVPARFKPLAAMTTTIYQNPDGTLAGLRTTGLPGNGQVDLWGANALVMTYGSVLDLYGRSRLVNVWPYVWMKRQVEKRIAALADKAAGTVPVITYNAGAGTDAAGNRVDARTTANNFGQALASVQLTHLAFPNALSILKPIERESATIDQLTKLLSLKLWDVDIKDMGDQGPAIEALIKLSEYLDVQIHRAYLRPERSTMEGSHGTKAEAGVHTDTGTADSDRIVRRVIIDAINQQIVDPMLVANWGETARGKVRLVAPSLRDKQAESDNQIITNLTTGPSAQWFAARFDVDEVAKRQGINLRETPLEMPAAPAPTPPGRDGQPVNGDAGSGDPLAKRMNGNGAALKMGRDDAWADLLDTLHREAGEAEGLSLSAGPYKFSSTQLDIPEPHRASILRMAAAIPDNEIDPTDGRETDPHVTVKYGIHADHPDDFSDLVAGTPAPVLTLGKLSLFPADAHRPSDVLKVDIHSPELHRLNKSIAEATPHTDTHPTYRPHMTVAYLKPGEGAKYVGSHELEGLRIKPDAVTFSSNDGTRTKLPFKTA